MLRDREQLSSGRREVETSIERRLPRPRLRRQLRRNVEADDRETIRGLIREIPRFLKLLYRLVLDSRVSRLDKGILAATVGYILFPMDLVPDPIPFLGQVDDVYLLALALHRLLVNAGPELLLEHWDGEIGALETALAALNKTGSLIPDKVRNRLNRRIE